MMLAVYLFLPIVVIGALAVLTVIRNAAAEAGRLGEALQALNQLQPAVIEVRSEVERSQQAIRQLRSR